MWRGAGRSRRSSVHSSQLAVQHAPRDIAARAWAAQIALERGDAAAAFSHYDRILRVAPEAQTTIFPVLAGLAAMPGARDALVSRLAEQPPWRASLLKYFCAQRRRMRTTCCPCSRAFGPGAVSVRTRTQLWSGGSCATGAGTRHSSRGRAGCRRRSWPRSEHPSIAASRTRRRRAARSSGISGACRAWTPASARCRARKVMPSGSSSRASAARSVTCVNFCCCRRAVGYQLKWRSRFDGLAGGARLALDGDVRGRHGWGDPRDRAVGGIVALASARGGIRRAGRLPGPVAHAGARCPHCRRDPGDGHRLVR